jgi:hypothetical protein
MGCGSSASESGSCSDLASSSADDDCSEATEVAAGGGGSELRGVLLVRRPEPEETDDVDEEVRRCVEPGCGSVESLWLWPLERSFTIAEGTLDLRRVLCSWSSEREGGNRPGDELLLIELELGEPGCGGKRLGPPFAAEGIEDTDGRWIESSRVEWCRCCSLLLMCSPPRGATS